MIAIATAREAKKVRSRRRSSKRSKETMRERGGDDDE